MSVRFHKGLARSILSDFETTVEDPDVFAGPLPALPGASLPGAFLVDRMVTPQPTIELPVQSVLDDLERLYSTGPDKSLLDQIIAVIPGGEKIRKMSRTPQGRVKLVFGGAVALMLFYLATRK